ncbi:MAG: restriction endonuclease subunit S [Candidatus Neomarinimicrobiota bacterium]|jgi:restriction endonuclease S subunit
MNRYPKYKPSGIEWIGEIPEHWDIATIGRLNNLGRGRVISNIEIGENSGEYPVYSSQTENNGIMGYLNSFDFEGQYVTWTTDGANAGTVFYREGKFNCTNVCGTIQPKNLDLIELKYLPYYLNLGTRFSVRLDINPKLMNNMIAKIPLVIPPKPEQTAIANYLDDKTARIDTLIEKKNRLIDLLKEERTAMINQAVTRGIDPDVKLRPSGIDWLGEIPEHWEVKKLKYVGKLRDELIDDSDFKIAVENIEIGTGKLMSIEEDKNYQGKLSAFRKGDTIFNKLRPYLHKVYYAEQDGGLYGELLIIYSFGEICSKFLFYKLFSKIFIDVVDGSTQGTKMPRANWNDFISLLFISFPKEKEEQLQIIQHIEVETKRIDGAISKIEREIELLQEYRTALISEVVTGKIKV